MGMREAGDGASLSAKLLQMLADQTYLEHLDSGQRVQMKMLTEVDIGEATASEQTEQAIVAKLLAHAVGHWPGLLFGT